RFQVPESLKPQAVTYVQARIFDSKTRLPLAARMGLVELKQNLNLLTDSTQQILVPLVPGGNYALNAYADGYLFQSRNFQPSEQSLDSPYTVDLYLDPIVANQRLVLENIFFDTDKSNLKSESEAELQRVFDWLEQNPKLRIEISGHTDSEGSDAYNLDLSKRRAGTVARYLVEKGLNAQRIQFEGYGETQPMASNETEEGRAKNRRIEMKIITL
ncbi:MAG: OmpA family protein, partial [Bacteroidia bacterium]